MAALRYSRVLECRIPFSTEGTVNVAQVFQRYASCVRSTLFIFLFTNALAQGEDCGGQWSQSFALPGINGTANASVVFNDGTGDALYVGGQFAVAGDTLAANIAKWNGTTWSAVGAGIDGEVFALKVFDSGEGPKLYAGGSFTTAGGVSAKNIAQWDGTNWLPLRIGVAGTVRALEVFDDGGGDEALYVGGSFATADGRSANNIAQWDGASWSSVGLGVNGTISTLEVFDEGTTSSLIAAGFFNTAGDVLATKIARWDGSTWSPVGTGVNSNINALATFDDGTGPALYAGGQFAMAGGIVANRVAKWDGSSWSEVGMGINGTVNTFSIFDDGGGPALYAGGSFNTAGNESIDRIAKWDGTTWSALGTGIIGVPRTLATYDDGQGPALYAGGDIVSAGEIGINNITKWNGSSWAALGSGPRYSGTDGQVSAFEVFDDGGGEALYAGGFFTNTGNAYARNISKWNGASWSNLDAGLNGSVRAFTVYDFGQGPQLFAGGIFTFAGSIPVDRLARWNGSTWKATGTGMNGWVYALTVFDEGDGVALFAGGTFRSAGNTDALGIAKWNWIDWWSLGTGVDIPNVRAFAVFDDGSGPALYAGGSFWIAGSITVRSIARWDGSSWSALSGSFGTGLNHAVYALEVFDDGTGPALHVGGEFTSAGATPANYIARWDGSEWSSVGSAPVGAGTNDIVYALRTFDDGTGMALYAGGDFTSAGGNSTNHIAKWDGASWQPLGVGINDTVSALIEFDDGGGPALYVGGTFTTAGGSVSANIARWRCPCTDNCPPPPALAVDAIQPDRERFFSIVVPETTAGQDTALRVTLDTLYNPAAPLPANPPDFGAREGEVRFVNLLRDVNGSPVTSCQSSPAFSTFYRCATLGCEPEYIDWGDIFRGTVIHVTGSSIIPDSTYRIAQLAISCIGNETSCVAASEELERTTARFGDVNGSGSVDVSDVVLTVDIVKDVAGADWEYQVYLRRETPEPQNDSANVTDIVLHVDALKLVAYPLSIPTCP